MEPIIIYGTGGFAREVLVLLEDINRAGPRWDILGFLDDTPRANETELNGYPILGTRDWLAQAPRKPQLALGVGSPAVKRMLSMALRTMIKGFPSLVHPSVIMSGRVYLGEGVVITAGNILTTEVELGDFCMVNLMCTVGHDVRMGRYVTISPGVNVSGNVRIGEGCEVGTGSKLIQGVTLGEWTIAGAGAVVSRDLPANCTAVGVPAKVIKERPSGWQDQLQWGHR
jgi:sugar O-acyltransferase (sialic acid O-acetyltransferase NeuD family)